MGNPDGALIQLLELTGALETEGNLQASLEQLAQATAHMLHAKQCSIMLLDEEEGGDLKLRVFAVHGELPEAAYKQVTRKGEGISGHVLATGQSLLIADLANSDFVAVARRLNAGSKTLISAPITVKQNIIGVINVSDTQSGRPFNLDDLRVLDVIALFAAKSIQVNQLQAVLNSRFAQMALAQETNQTMEKVIGYAGENPNHLAKILAKAFFKEMTKAGFSSTQIIHAASEIIAQLNSSLGKHSKRLERK